MPRRGAEGRCACRRAGEADLAAGRAVHGDGRAAGPGLVFGTLALGVRPPPRRTGAGWTEAAGFIQPPTGARRVLDFAG